MNEKNFNTLMIVGFGAIGIYLLFKKVIPNFTAPVVNTLADWYAAFTMPGAMVPQGSILFPDGSTQPMTAFAAGIPSSSGSIAAPTSPIAVQMGPGGIPTNYFSYNGQSWLLTGPADSNGNYLAVAQ